MKMRFIYILLGLLCPFCTKAQTFETDSTQCADVVNGSWKTDAPATFRAKQLILPASLVAVGSLGVFVPGIKHFNRDVCDKMADWRGKHFFHADEYIQYLPVVSTFGLSLLGAKAKHSYADRILVTATAYAAMGIITNGIKYTVKEKRPDSSARNSFPSGHSATAFMGAELVRMEYGKSSPLYGVGAYGIACGVGFLRAYNERHWCTDVIAGAGIGILSARIGYWLLPLERKLFRFDKKKSANLIVCPIYESRVRSFGAMFDLHI